MTSSGIEFMSIFVKIGVLVQESRGTACPPSFLEEYRVKVMTTGRRRRPCKPHTTFYMTLLLMSVMSWIL